MTSIELAHYHRHRRRMAILRGNWRGFPAVFPPRNGATVVGLWAHGGITRIHGYLMSDGSIATMRDDEADRYRIDVNQLEEIPGTT
jgi:hypothetical protein